MTITRLTRMPPAAAQLALDRLSDATLMTTLRDAIAEAQRRAGCGPELRRLLADALVEEKLLMLAGADLPAEHLLAIAAVTVPVPMRGPGTGAAAAGGEVLP